jgi:multimeric flavodoxin WrbA
VPVIIIAASLFSGVVGQIINVYIDMIIRSAVISLIFIVPVYLLEISSDTNQMIDNYLKWLGVFRRKSDE